MRRPPVLEANDDGLELPESCWCSRVRRQPDLPGHRLRRGRRGHQGQWTIAGAFRPPARPGPRGHRPVELERRTLLDDLLPRRYPQLRGPVHGAVRVTGANSCCDRPLHLRVDEAERLTTDACRPSVSTPPRSCAGRAYGAASRASRLAALTRCCTSSATSGSARLIAFSGSETSRSVSQRRWAITHCPSILTRRSAYAPVPNSL